MKPPLYCQYFVIGCSKHFLLQVSFKPVVKHNRLVYLQLSDCIFLTIRLYLFRPQ